mmetsp:Transcript_35388/g.77512  ORF Transcript_35388/g.77512 Transcript_35388/m.77512 type:complete len:454 (-) Transcript_35388:144-1505(-)
MRNNGFERPYNTMQMATWVLLPLLIVHFLIFVSPVLPVGASVPCTLLFLAAGTLSAYFAYKCCITDPVDDKLARHLKKQRDGNGGSSGSSGDVEAGGTGEEADDDGNDPTKYCWVCQTNVHDKSMHCKFCDKCVSRFDHHCMWLNTCVGSANYRYFFRTVVATFCFVTVDAACLAGIVIAYFVQAYGPNGAGGAQVDRMRDWMGADLPLVNAIVNVVFLVINLGSAFLIGQLFFFHINLQREDITTYEYIVRENQKKREKNKDAKAVRSKRIVMIRAAQNRRDKGMVRKLQMGRLCVPCDPARQAVQEDKKREAEEKARREQEQAQQDQVREVSRYSSSSSEAGEGGFQEEQDVKQGSGGSETDQQACDVCAPLQEAMAARQSDLEASAKETGEQKKETNGTGSNGNGEPQFLSVGVTECTHPSASAASAPTDKHPPAVPETVANGNAGAGHT